MLRQRNALLSFSQVKEQQGLERESPVLATNPITGGSLLLGESGSLEEAVGWKQRINKVTCNSYLAEIFPQLNEIKIGMLIPATWSRHLETMRFKQYIH